MPQKENKRKHTSNHERKNHGKTATKSTVLNYVNNQKNNGEDTGTRKEYVNKLTRNQVRNLIIARSKRLPTKANHQYKYEDKWCRWCD